MPSFIPRISGMGRATAAATSRARFASRSSRWRRCAASRSRCSCAWRAKFVMLTDQSFAGWSKP
jgi:hypothetical protein